MIKIENQPDEFEKDLEELLRIITKKIVKKRALSFKEDEITDRVQQMKSAVFAGIREIERIDSEPNIGDLIREELAKRKKTDN